MKLRMTAAFLALATFASIASAGEIKPFSRRVRPSDAGWPARGSGRQRDVVPDLQGAEADLGNPNEAARLQGRDLADRGLRQRKEHRPGLQGQHAKYAGRLQRHPGSGLLWGDTIEAGIEGLIQKTTR